MTGAIDHANLVELAGSIGVHDVACPLCGPERRSPVNRRRKVLRVWRIAPDFATFRCARCGAAGYARADGAKTPDRTVLARARAEAARFEQATAESKRERARWLWRQRQPIAGTAGEHYLRRARGYAGPLPTTLGFLPARDRYSPAMIAAFAMPPETHHDQLSVVAAAVQAVHLTRLAPDGSGKAGSDADKIVIGAPLHAPIVLAMPSDLGGLAITEGIEDALSVHEATGLGAWAAGSAALMPTLANVVPNYVEAVTVVFDGDEAGRRNAAALSERLEARGIDTRLVACWSKAV